MSYPKKLKPVAIFLWALLNSSFIFAQSKIDTCKTGVYLKNVFDLKPSDYSFNADFWIWFDFDDKNFDPLKNIEIINAKEISASDSYYSVDKYSHVASETIKAKLNHDWELRNFPFDSQNLEIIIEAGLDTTKMILRQDNSRVYKGLQIPGWNIRSFKTSQYTVTYESDFGEKHLKGRSSYSRIKYELKVERKSWGLYFKLLTGLYISFLVSFLVFFIHPENDSRFGLSIGGLFAAVGNKYVVDNNIPGSINFSFLDKVHDVTFFFILLTLCVSVISLKISENTISSKRKNFNRYSCWFLFVTYIVSNIILTIGAIDARS